MPKLFRRTWERQKYGRAGAISTPLSARTGTDGAIAGANFTTPVAVFTSATGAFVASDVGRKIRLSGTASNRYDGNYVIDSVNSSTSINLRFNHNVGGTPASPARFFENGSSITWRIHESCTFTADAAGDIEDFHPGSYLYVESTNLENRGLWLISHRTSSSVVTLSKSYIWFPIDNNPFTVHTIDATTDFIAETSLRWYITDRQPMSVQDSYETILQFYVDCGWSLWQQRGHHTTLGTLRDVVLKSIGETDPLIPGGKAMYLRWGVGGSRSGVKVWGFMDMDAAIYHHWDPAQTATAPGSGVGGTKTTTNYSGNPKAAFPSSGWAASNGGMWTIYPFRYSGSTSFVTTGRNGLLDQAHFTDWSMFGDADEVFVNGSCYGGVNAQNTAKLTFGHLKVVGSNPNIVTVINNVTAGTNKDLNTGTVDIAALTPPYQVGDKITIIGRKTAAPAEYVETTSIVSFNNTDPNNRLVRVANLALAYGNGPETLKLQIGEDPFPVVVGGWTSNSTQGFLHNLTNLGNATGRDHDATNLGSSSTLFEIWSLGFGEIDPNIKTGRYGILALGVRNTGIGEVRGRYRYYWDIPDYIGSLGLKMVAANGTDVYVLVAPIYNGGCIANGPMSKVMAGIYT